MIHGPSLAIGAAIASVSLVIAFLGFSMVNDEPELVIEPATNPQPSISPSVISSTFMANGSPILGDPNAPVTLIEFGDYQCHFCNVHFHNTEHSLLENFIQTGKVKMIFKDFTIIGPDSINAAHGAHCANDQGKFWEYHDILYNNWTGENNGWASSVNLLGFAQEIGLDIDEWSECMLDARHSQIITDSSKDARDLGITGTPAFFVIGPDNKITKISGAQPYERFEQIFNEELEKVS
ncbi:MAG: DsbA family protein [Nitrosopumilaceae archaeon]|uniref:DsbA family protein n=1 Tax=Candidatus Nitrosomaritimum aestuariumsis TaxID=3342354 RepID=A0AC60W165_9ARCH|nr:DsbA family protein [Nitrosopumilaceae archaeon]